MAALLARYRVRDPDVFRRVFEGFEATRAELGVTGHRALAGADDPAVVVVLFELPSAQLARAYATDPRRTEALDRAGVAESEDLVLEDLRGGA
jgi:hypothetical protein